MTVGVADLRQALVARVDGSTLADWVPATMGGAEALYDKDGVRVLVKWIEGVIFVSIEVDGRRWTEWKDEREYPQSLSSIAQHFKWAHEAQAIGRKKEQDSKSTAKSGIRTGKLRK